MGRNDYEQTIGIVQNEIPKVKELKENDKGCV